MNMSFSSFYSKMYKERGRQDRIRRADPDITVRNTG